MALSRGEYLALVVRMMRGLRTFGVKVVALEVVSWLRKSECFGWMSKAVRHCTKYYEFMRFSERARAT